MDVAAEFGVLLCYIIAAYARLIAIDLAYHCFVSSPGDLTVSRALAVSAVTFPCCGKTFFINNSCEFEENKTKNSQKMCC